MAGWLPHGPVVPTEPTLSRNWVAAAYDAVAGSPEIQPLLVSAVHLSTQAPAMVLPLVRRRRDGLQVIEFVPGMAGGRNPPILWASSPSSGTGMQDLCGAVYQAVRGADLLHLADMPETIAGRPNPLAAMANVTRPGVRDPILTLDDDWTEFWYGLERGFRKSLERAGRSFAELPGAAFRCERPGPRAAGIARDIERLFGGTGAHDGNAPAGVGAPFGPLLRGMAEGDPNDASTVVAALTVGDVVVAGLVAISAGSRCTVVGAVARGGEWSRYALRRVLIARTLRALHAEGDRAFDLGLAGDPAFVDRASGPARTLLGVGLALSRTGRDALGQAGPKTLMRRVLALGRPGGARRSRPSPSAT